MTTAIPADKPYVNALLLTGLGTAAICVLSRLIMQFISPVFATKSMRLQFQYCLALFGHYVVFMVAPIPRANTTACSAVAVLESYLIMTTFVWMTILSLDMYRAIKTLKSPTITATNKQTKWQKCRDTGVESAIGWGAVLPFTALAVAMDHVDGVDDQFRLNFGKTVCFAEPAGFEHFAYFAPLFVTSAINVVVFIRTALFLRKAFDKRRQLTLTKRYHYASYVKLFVIMGINYSLVLFIPFFDNIVLWVTAATAHTLKGIYIAVTYVFTRKVWKSLQNDANKSDSNRVDRCQQRSEHSNPPFILGS